jgi:putative ABC transport system permease protein
MTSLYRIVSLRYLRRRWDRAALVVLSIALGVATLVSSRVLNERLDRATGAVIAPGGAGDLLIGNGDAGVGRDVLTDLRAANLPGVASMRPLVVRRVTLPGQGGRGCVLLGVELSPDSLQAGTENPLGFTFTRTLDDSPAGVMMLLTRRVVIVSKDVHDAWAAARASPTDPLVLKLGSRELACLPVGYFQLTDASRLGGLGDAIVGLDLDPAARFARPDGETRYDRIDVTLAPGAGREAVQQAAQQVVGVRGKVRTPEAHGQSTREIVGGIQVAFTLSSLGVMIVGLFLVYNAMAVTVAERRHDIGVLRSLGATRGQVVRLFAVMAAALGLLGAALGVPAGALLARLLIGQFREELGSIFYDADLSLSVPSASTTLIAVIAGVGTAVFAAVLPATQAATQDPADAVRRTPGAAGGWWAVAHRVVCALLVGVGLAAILLRHDLPHRVGAFGGVLLALTGLLLATPILVGILLRVIHPVLRAVLPIEARLAADNLIRSPGRTGVVIGALAAGVAVMVQTAGVGRSNEVPVVHWLDEVIQADRFLFSGGIADTTSSAAPLDPKLVAELKAIPGVENAVGLRYARPEYGGTLVFLVAIDGVEYAESNARRVPAIKEGLDKLRRLKEPGGVLVSENFARRHAKQPGETLTLPGPRGPVTLTILDTVRDYSWSRGTIFIDRTAYAETFADPLTDIVHVYLTDPSPDSPASQAVAALAAERGLTVLDRPTVRKFLADLIDRVYVLAYLQQIVVGIVAALGVVTALLISVLQRKRELGLLLAVGATPGQIVRSVLAEALLMGILGTAMGVAFGLPLEWYVVRVILLEESGFLFEVLIPWREGLLIAVGSVAVAALAGLLPAYRAVRTRVADAVAYE